MAVGLADNRGTGHQQSLPDEVGVRVPEENARVSRRTTPLPVDPDLPEEQGLDRGEERRRSGVLRSRWDVLLVISAGGALGSLARWGVGELVPWSGDGFPWATFVENVSGGFALGVLMVFLLDVWPPRRYLRPFLGVGVLGGYTTFSTYMLEARDLLVGGEPAVAFTYLAGSLVAGLTAVWLGIALARAAAGETRPRRRRQAQADSPQSDRGSNP
jgi:CrcB protein